MSRHTNIIIVAALLVSSVGPALGGECSLAGVTKCTDILSKASSMTNTTEPEQCVVIKSASKCLQEAESMCIDKPDFLSVVSTTMEMSKPVITICDSDLEGCKLTQFMNCIKPLETKDEVTREIECSLWKSSKECLFNMVKEGCPNTTVSAQIYSSISHMETTRPYCHSLEDGCSWKSVGECTKPLHTMEAENKGDTFDFDMCIMSWESKRCLENLLIKGCKENIEDDVRGIMHNISMSTSFCFGIGSGDEDYTGGAQMFPGMTFLTSIIMAAITIAITIRP